MRLTIITINRNNAAGLEETMRSVAIQTYKEFEYIIVDGASTDASVEVIRDLAPLFGLSIKWVSEPDTGIYNAMNKGIGMASGDYVQFLNSGDSLVSEDVVEIMLKAIDKNEYPTILYGNMLKKLASGKTMRDCCFAGKDITFLDFYTGTLNHSSAYIQRCLFSKYGLYDERFMIVSDWKWYLEAVVLGEEKPVYADIDVSLFDMNGISEMNKTLDNTERKCVLKELIPYSFLADYDIWATDIRQMERLKRHPWVYRFVWLLERGLFKIEKRKNKRKNEF